MNTLISRKKYFTMNWLKRIFAKGNSEDSFTVRQGKVAKTDESFNAWTSGDLDRMMQATKKKTNPVDRHFLLSRIVEETYKRRNDSEIRKLCKEFSEKHINEFPNLSPYLKKEFDNRLPRIPTFQKYSTILTEDKQFQEAIKVCEIAIKNELEDGTKSGFKGRIEKIKRKGKIE